jgi:hypothetical protein
VSEGHPTSGACLALDARSSTSPLALLNWRQADPSLFRQISLKQKKERGKRVKKEK